MVIARDHFSIPSSRIMDSYSCLQFYTAFTYEPVHEISNTVVCATSKGSDQPAHTRILIRAFASRLSILCLLSY